MADRSSEIVSLIRAISDKVEGGGGGSTDIKDLPDSTDLRGTWSSKQDAIDDLSTIRSGAALGATALQSFTETDPTVPAWAKASVKPSYSASEITNAVSSTTVSTIWKGTQAQYDAISVKDPYTLYIIV